MKKMSLTKLGIILLTPLLFITSCNKDLPYSKISDSSNSATSDVKHEENDYKKILAPSVVSFSIDDNEIKWSEVSGASSYEINVNGKIIASNITKTSYKVSNDIINPQSGEKYLISVRAIDSTKQNKSNYKSFLFDNNLKSDSIFDYYLNDDNTTLTLSTINKAKQDLVTAILTIPSTINGFNVTTIGENLFNGNKKISEVILPSSIKEIQNGAFMDSTLASISLNENLQLIGKNAFTRCSKLTKVTIPDSVVTIDSSAFLGCGSLNEVSFSSNSSLKEINSEAFKNCSKLTGFVLPSNVNSIGNNAFENAGLTAFDMTNNKIISEFPSKMFSGCKFITYTIPTQIKKINDGVFLNCNSLQTLFIDENTLIDEIPSLFIKGCSLLKYFGKASAYDDTLKNQVIINIPNSIKVINTEAFSSLKATSIIFENNSSLDEIKDLAFSSNSVISEITLPSSLQFIGDSAFSNCNKLKDISFADVNNIKRIGKNAFNGTSFLSTFENNRVVIGNVFYKASSDDKKQETFTFTDNVVSISAEAFKNSACKNFVFSKNLMYIDNEAFKGSKMTSLVLPDSLLEIGDNAFSECKSLTNVSFNATSSLTSFGEGTFKDCTALKSLNVPAAISTLPKDFLAMSNLNVSALETITLNNSLVSIEENAFKNCSSLNSITLPNSVKVIGNSAFINTTSLAHFTISENSALEVISTSAFENSALENIYLPASLIYLQTMCFKNCTSLSEVSFSNNAFSNSDEKVLNELVFENCTSLKEITLPDSITTIKENAFKDATSLLTINTKASEVDSNAFNNTAFSKSFTDGIVNFNGILLQYTGNASNVVIPNDINIIGKNAFKGNNKVITIHIPTNVETIKESAFENCSSLKEIIVDGKTSSLKDIENNAFSNCVALENISFSNAINKIGEYAFYNCYKLKNVTLESEYLSVIEKYSFANCNSLDNIRLSSSIVKIGDYAFFHCNLKEVIIPSSVLEIGDYAFSSNGLADNVLLEPSSWTITPSIKKLTFANNSLINKIGKYAFLNNIIDEINLPDNEIYLDEYCFSGSSKIKSFTIKNSYYVTQGIIANSNSINKVDISSIKNLLSAFGGNILDVPETLNTIEVIDGDSILPYAFSSFGMVKEIILPESITSIGEYAFYGCYSIKSINISNVTKIYANAFTGCSNLETINFSNSLEYIGSKAFMATKYINTLDNEEFVMINNVLIKYNGSSENVVLPNNVSSIAGGAFAGNHTIKKITLSENTKLLCNGAFDSCINLKEIEVNYNGLVEIELEIFDTLPQGFIVKVFKDSLSLYDDDIYWSLYDNNIKTK